MVYDGEFGASVLRGTLGCLDAGVTGRNLKAHLVLESQKAQRLSVASGEEPVPGSDDTAEGINFIPQENKDSGRGREVGEGGSASFTALLTPVLCGNLAVTGASSYSLLFPLQAAVWTGTKESINKKDSVIFCGSSLAQLRCCCY